MRLTTSHSGGSAISYQPLRMETRVCLSYLSPCSDMLLLVCVTHTSQQSFDPSDQGLPLTRCSFDDTRVSISIENGLSIGLVQALTTLVLVSTYIYLEKAAKLVAIYRHLGLPRSTSWFSGVDRTLDFESETRNQSRFRAR